MNAKAVAAVPTTSTTPSLTEIFDETAALMVGGGIVVLALFPLALPIIALTAVIAIAAGVLAVAVVFLAAPILAPVLLLRRHRRGAQVVALSGAAPSPHTPPRLRPERKGRPGEPRAHPRSSNALLILIGLAQFIVVLDVSIVNVALPTIRDRLGFSTPGLQWVVNAYTLTFAGFLLLGGRAADLLGRRRVFLCGAAVFAPASLASAVARSPAALLAARAIQGVGGAVISAAGLAILTTSFAEGVGRNRALGVWSAMAGLGGTSGVLLGGLLTQAFGWRAIFVINVPVGLAVVVAGRHVIPARGPESQSRHFDIAGALLATAGMAGVTFGIVRSETTGWGAPGVLGPLAAGLALLGLFGLVEGKLASEPLMPLRILRMPSLRAANLIVLLLYAPFFAMWFFLSLYMHVALGYDAIQTGLAFLPMTIGVVLVASLVPRIVARFGPRLVLIAALLLAASGLLLLTRISAGGTYLSDVVPGGVVAAMGLAGSLVLATIVAVQGVPAAHSGLASALINTARLQGGALGLAVLTTVATSHTNSELASGVGSVPALADGYQLAFAAGAAISLLAALLAAVMIRRGGEAARRPAEQASGAA